MNDNMGKVWFLLDSDEITKTTHDEVAEHLGHEVSNFDKLTDAVTKLNFYNPNLNLYFRGQTRDHKIKRRRENEKTMLLPGAYRKKISPDKEASSEYLTGVLPAMKEDLMKELQQLPSWKRRRHRLLVKGMQHFDETQWAILQHYECETPLLDVTQSLEVACWFATHELPTGVPSEEGFLYVLGLPNIHGHISFFPCDGIVMVKLQSACPPEAKRPHYQQGYLVGSTPHTPQPYTYRPRDVALRLVAKCRIGDPGTFWNTVGNHRLSLSTLMPKEDRMKHIVDEIRERY
jgi:hypothetical protein